MSTSVLETIKRAADAGERAVPCPACNGQNLNVLLSPDDLDAEREWLEKFYARRVDADDDLKDRVAFTLAEPTYIVQCDDCGTLLRDPQPTCAALGQRYAADSYGRATLEQLAANQLEFFRRKLRQVAPFVQAGDRLLEVGSFVGGFLRAAAEQDWMATGLDVGAETYEFQQSLGLEVMQSNICNAALLRQAWQGIFIWNTFDQLCNPAEVLDCVRQLLTDEGLLVLRVPNGLFEIECLNGRHRWRGKRREQLILKAQAYNNFLTFPYLTGYTAPSLTHFLETHGFAVQTIHGDTLLRLADANTLPWAAQEEQQIKNMTLRFCRAVNQLSGEFWYPWIDVYARKQRQG